MRFVVKKRIPGKYSRTRKNTIEVSTRSILRYKDYLPETRAFRPISCQSRFIKNTSASSNKRTQPIRFARVKCRSRFFSMSAAVVPMSPQVIEYRGRFVCAAIVSAVLVFPAPGGPCNKIISPSPFPRTRSICVEGVCFSTTLSEDPEEWSCTKATRCSRYSSGMTSPSNPRSLASSLLSISLMRSTFRRA